MEIQRFGPEADQAAAELDRSGGILGWPGFVFATAALVLAMLDTWWGIAGTWWGVTGAESPSGSVFEQEQLFAEMSLLAAPLCLAVCSLVLILISCRECGQRYRRLRRSGQSCFFSFVRAISNLAVLGLSISALIAGAVSWESVNCSAEVFQKTPSSLLMDILERIFS